MQDSSATTTTSNESTKTRSILATKCDEIDGKQAWITLACIFVINATTLGSLKVYGLIFEEIVSQNYYDREQASWPISTASTIQNLAGLLTPLLTLRITWCQIELLQTFTFIVANLGAYFSNGIALDILCLGILQGVSLSIRYNMNVVINNEYFIKYRATAMGISLAGSTCGVFALKPIISHVLDTSNHQFRNAYLALAVVTSFTLILSVFIRKPKYTLMQNSSVQPKLIQNSQVLKDEDDDNDDEEESLNNSLRRLLKSPSMHCVWVMQTIYFYISRTYTIFIVDFGIDKGFSRTDSRNLLDFWVYGEVGGRFLLGSLVDAKILSIKWNIVIVNCLLSISSYLLLLGHHQGIPDHFYFWLFGISIALIAALSSLSNMMIIPFSQEYLGKKNVPWAFALASIVTSFFLLLRPNLIGFSRDHLKSYDFLILVLATGPGLFAILFTLLEPLLKRCTTTPTTN